LIISFSFAVEILFEYIKYQLKITGLHYENKNNTCVYKNKLYFCQYLWKLNFIDIIAKRKIMFNPLKTKI